MQYAVKLDLIPTNPADRIDLPKTEPYTAKYYTREDILKIINLTKNTKLETPIMFACFYGLRRSEIIGLKWSAINFDNKTISISHVVTQMGINHNVKIIKKDRTKTKSSKRTLPLLPIMESYLLSLKYKQEKNKKFYKNKYNKEFLDYICVDDTGNLLQPNYITHTFRNLLIKNNFVVNRFHDLRHSVASLLISNGINMKQIQVWLGHSNYSTTANIYTHLDFHSMYQSANAISKALDINNYF